MHILYQQTNVSVFPVGEGFSAAQDSVGFFLHLLHTYILLHTLTYILLHQLWPDEEWQGPVFC